MSFIYTSMFVTRRKRYCAKFSFFQSSTQTAFGLDIMDDVSNHIAVGGTTFDRYVNMYNMGTGAGLRVNQSSSRSALVKDRLITAFFWYHAVLISKHCMRFVARNMYNMYCLCPHLWPHPCG